jgi:hypothetical protein
VRVNEQELRALVRSSVSRRLAERQASGPAPIAPAGANGPAAWQQHPSHHIYVTIVNSDDACVIEPNVACHHCGFCKSHGY